MTGIQKTKNKFYALLQQLEPDCENAGFKFTNLKKDQNYVWIKDSEGILGNSKAHFEFTRNGEDVCIDIHFEEAKTRSLFYKEIGAVPQPLKWMEWKSVPNAAIRYSEHSLSEPDLKVKLLEDLIDFDELIGDRVREAQRYLKDYTWYVKKAVPQDVTKTIAINKRAQKDFFRVKELKKDEEEIIKLRHLPSSKVEDVRIAQKTDLRIYLNRTMLREDDYIVYHRLKDGTFTAEFVNDKDPEYASIEEQMAGKNYQLFYSLRTNDEMENKQPLNQILFGPPGTGKTYSTVTRALNILGLLEWKEKYNDEEYSEAQEMFKQELGNRIEFVTMHQSFSYEDFVQGLKPGKGKNGIEFSYENGVFKDICERARGFEEYGKHSYFSSYIMSVYEEDVKELFPNNIISQDDRLKFLAKKIDNSKGQILVKGPRDVFDRILGDKSPREGWTKENFKNKEVWDTCERTCEYFESIPKEVCISLFKKHWIEPEHINIDDKDLKEMSLRNFVIILDEINRANISKVFGELITLIEDDKREMISTTLPSGEPFTVPKNLYIIGTMNTADRSVSNIDIALRRRFEFIPLYPDKELISDPVKKEFMENINTAITGIGKKSIDFRIGHADFMKSLSLINTINRKTIPLLMEYFRNNGDTVLEIIRTALPKTSGIKVEMNDYDIPEARNITH